MQTELSEAYAMTNYVIVEVACHVCGKSTAKFSADGWDGHKSCPTCHRACECVYLGHGFSSDQSAEAMSGENVTERCHQQVC